MNRHADVLHERDFHEAMHFAAEHAEIAETAGDERRRDFWLELMHDAHEAGVAFTREGVMVGGGSDS